VVARALEFVHRRGATGISLRDVASHVARSPAHVASLVKTATGVTVVGWITRARLSEGRQLLLHTDESIEAIAERCGFASPSHFHRAFKRAHGAPPGEWRRAHRT
jgi:AraC-like DNA-binding protein